MRPFMLLLVIVGCGPSGTTPLPQTSPAPAEDSAVTVTPPINKTPIVSVDAVALWSEYGANALAADAKYKNKYVTIIGIISELSQKDGRNFVGFQVMAPVAITNAQYAGLTEQEKKWFSEGFPANVICFLPENPSRGFFELKTRRPATIVAKVVGRQDNSNVFKGYTVSLEDSHFPE